MGIRRTISTGISRATEVICSDDLGAGNACHEYEIKSGSSIKKADDYTHGTTPILTEIHFQKGPIQENGINGCQNEDLIAIVIDRLQGFQSGNFKCRENEMALAKLDEALLWLNKRTTDRQNRGVEGKSLQ
jgi:hypothetical protein